MSLLLLFRVACRFFYFLFGRIFGLALRKPVRVSCLFCLFLFPSFYFLLLFIVDSLFLFLQSLIASACFMCLSCFSILPLFVPVSLFFLILHFWPACDPSVFWSGFNVSISICSYLFFLLSFLWSLLLCPPSFPRTLTSHFLFPVSCFMRMSRKQAECS